MNLKKLEHSSISIWAQSWVLILSSDPSTSQSPCNLVYMLSEKTVTKAVPLGTDLIYSFPRLASVLVFPWDGYLYGLIPTAGFLSF